MPYNAQYRTSVILSLMPEESGRLLDVGCGPVTSEYPYASRATEAVCTDWKLKTFGKIPQNITLIEGDFSRIELPDNSFDTIIAADVFEHVTLEHEPAFIERCVALLKPGGNLILSVPHRGTFGWLDPYQVKPTLHRMLWRVGLFGGIHNGYCDIRKGHKHYTVGELATLFERLEIRQVRYTGYFFDPILSWVSALRLESRLPGYQWLEQACKAEYERDYGVQSFNLAVRLQKRDA